MTKPKEITGSCLCGRVHYKVVGPFTDFRYCHCERCRKATGSAHAANLFMPKDQLVWISGQEDIVFFLHKEADNYPRAFCRNCGSMVPRLGRDTRFMVVPGGTLEIDPGMKPTKNIFWKLRASWHVHTSELPTHDEKPA